MEKYKRIISTLIFNIAETILIFLVGRMLRLEINNIIIVMLCFMVSRGFFGKTLHFKTWYRCLIWSLLILLRFTLLRQKFTLSNFSLYENKTYQEIAELKGFDDNTITKRECATIYSVLERPLNLPPIIKK